MTETVEIDASELARLREAAERPSGFTEALVEGSVRDRSPVKPEDHKRAADEVINIEYKGVTFEVKAGILGQLRVLDALERNQFVTALRRIVGDEGFEAFLEAVPEASAEDAGEILELIADRAGAKNS